MDVLKNDAQKRQNALNELTAAQAEYESILPLYEAAFENLSNAAEANSGADLTLLNKHYRALSTEHSAAEKRLRKAHSDYLFYTGGREDFRKQCGCYTS